MPKIKRPTRVVLPMPRLMKIRQLPCYRPLENCAAIRHVDYGVFFVANGVLYVHDVNIPRLHEQVPYFVRKIHKQLIALGVYTQSQFDQWERKYLRKLRAETRANAIQNSLWQIRESGVRLSKKIRDQVTKHHTKKAQKYNGD